MGQKRLRALQSLWNTLQTSDYFKSMTFEFSPCPTTYAAISRILCRWSCGTPASSRSVALPENQEKLCEKLCDCACCKHFENSLKPSVQCPGFLRFSEVFILLRLFLVRVQWEPPRPRAVQEVLVTVSFRCSPSRPCSDEIVWICRRLQRCFGFAGAVNWSVTLSDQNWKESNIVSVQSVFLLKLLKCFEVRTWGRTWHLNINNLRDSRLGLFLHIRICCEQDVERCRQVRLWFDDQPICTQIH